MADLKDYIETLAEAARKASVGLRTLSADAKNAALMSMAQSIDARRAPIKGANARDLERGKEGRAFRRDAGPPDPHGQADRRHDHFALREIAALEDPVGEVIGVRRPAGFTLEKVRTPIGVIAMIYESRPNVTWTRRRSA